MRRIYILLAVTLFYSCSKKQKVYNHLQGQWLIEAIYYNNQNVITEYLSNGVDFEDDFSHLPTKIQKVNDKINWNLTQIERGKIISWDLIQKDTLFYIKFHTKDEVFGDTLQIRFYREDGFNKMDLTNKHAYIKLSKWEFQNPDDMN
ncbi:MAG: hypothetical protein AB1304_11715 [Bacteroidota bacterium]